MDNKTLAANYKRKPENSVNNALKALSELAIAKRNANGQYNLRET